MAIHLTHNGLFLKRYFILTLITDEKVETQSYLLSMTDETSG